MLTKRSPAAWPPLPIPNGEVDDDAADGVRVCRRVHAEVADQPIEARIPEQRVVAVAAEQFIVVKTADQRIVATVAEQHIVARPAVQMIIADDTGLNAELDVVATNDVVTATTIEGVVAAVTLKLVGYGAAPDDVVLSAAVDALDADQHVALGETAELDRPHEIDIHRVAEHGYPKRKADPVVRRIVDRISARAAIEQVGSGAALMRSLPPRPKTSSAKTLPPRKLSLPFVPVIAIGFSL
jgi:hypothetical protein